MVVIITSATAGIMSTESKSARRLICGVGLGVGLLLIGLSFPRVMAYFYIAMVPSGITEALDQGRGIEGQELDEARAYYLKALAFLPRDAVIQQDYGRLELHRAANKPDERIAALRSASEHFRASIETAPSRPFAWSLEAVSELELQADPALLNDLLRMSYYLGPHEASSLMLRVRVGCRIWEVLDGDVKGFIANDLKALWSEGRLRSKLLDVYLGSSLNVRIAIREIVFDDPARQKIFDQMLERILNGPVR